MPDHHVLKRGHELVATLPVLMNGDPVRRVQHQRGPASGNYDQKKQLFAEDVLSKAGVCAVIG